MSWITPPTDNLYKFISIFGLVIIIASAFFWFQTWAQIEKDWGPAIKESFAKSELINLKFEIAVGPPETVPENKKEEWIKQKEKRTPSRRKKL